MIRGRPSTEPQTEVIAGATLAVSPVVREQAVLQARLAAARYYDGSVWLMTESLAQF